MTLYGLSKDKSVARAIGTYQQQNPDVQITYYTAQSEEGAVADADSGQGRGQGAYRAMKNKIIRGSLLMAAGIMLSGSLYFAYNLTRFADTMSVEYREGGLTCREIDNINKGQAEENTELPYITGWDKSEAVPVKAAEIDRTLPKQSGCRL